MDELVRKLNQIPDSYIDFVMGVYLYAKSKKEHLELLLNYLDANPNVSTSDVIYFMSIQPDFHDDDVPIKESQYVG